jgi:N-lysine methyltransferase SETD6
MFERICAAPPFGGCRITPTPSLFAELQASAVTQKIGKQKAEEIWKDTIIPIMEERPAIFPTSNTQDREQNLIQLAHMAGSLIMAYAFDIDRDDGKDGQDDKSDAESFEEDDEDEPLKGMVPFADMLNADADRNNVSHFRFELSM